MPFIFFRKRHCSFSKKARVLSLRLIYVSEHAFSSIFLVGSEEPHISDNFLQDEVGKGDQ
jgi:hypothetical protein